MTGYPLPCIPCSHPPSSLYPLRIEPGMSQKDYRPSSPHFFFLARPRTCPIASSHDPPFLPCTDQLDNL